MVKAEGAAISIAGTPPGAPMMAHSGASKKYAAERHHKSGHVLAYATERQAGPAPTVDLWQINPMQWWQ